MTKTRNTLHIRAMDDEYPWRLIDIDGNQLASGLIDGDDNSDEAAAAADAMAACERDGKPVHAITYSNGETEDQ